QERRGAPDAIADYFATEVLGRMDADTRDTLLRTAFLPQVTTALAEGLTGRPAAGRALAELHRLQCFIVQHSGHETVYENTPMFRPSLLRRAHALFPPEEHRAIARQAAPLLTRDGRIETAGTVLRSARDWEGVAGLVEAYGATLVARHQLDTLS